MIPDKIFNPGIDVTDHIIPLNFSKIFNNKNPVHLEIGSGDGDFIVELAVNNQKINFVGIEIKRNRYKKGIRKAQKLNCINIKLLYMDARIAIEELIYPDSLYAIYINFPDPWPKDKHTKHRLINKEFVDILSNRIINNGILEIASDHKEYIFNSINILSTSKNFSNQYGEQKYLNEVKGRPSTKFEQEYRNGGSEIYYLKYINHK